VDWKKTANAKLYELFSPIVFSVAHNQQRQMSMRNHFPGIMFLNKMPGIPGNHRHQAGVCVFLAKIIVYPANHAAAENSHPFAFNLRIEKRKKKIPLHPFRTREFGIFWPNTSLSPGTAYKDGQYAIVNLVTTPFKNFLAAAELEYGSRTIAGEKYYFPKTYPIEKRMP
jgi:hypothetical protein